MKIGYLMMVFILALLQLCQTGVKAGGRPCSKDDVSTCLSSEYCDFGRNRCFPK